MDDHTQRRPWVDQEIRSQLERILGHPEFRATDRMRDFLRFVVEQTLAGNERQLKGFTIATEVFGRDDDFDAAHDPVVRIQAGRLRRALERYYLVAGGADPIYIDIPKGGYVPEFSEVPGAGPRRSASRHEPETDRAGAWPCLQVLPFKDLTGREELAFLAPGLATELSIELANTGDLRVLLSADAPEPVPASALQADFTIRGSVRAEGDTIKLAVQLVRAASGEQLWADVLKSTLEEDRMISFQERTAATIAARVAGEHGAVFRAASETVQSQSGSCQGSYGAILKGYAYHQRIDLPSYLAANEALREAHARDAGCGLVCTMLAVMYLDNIALEFFDTAQTPLNEALRLAREGVRLEPNVQLCRLVLARSYLFGDDLEAGLEEVEAAHALHPESLLFLDVIGYLLALLGDWERGAAMVRRAISLNPYYRVFTRFATWLDCFRQGDYHGALEESRWITDVGFFWAPLSRAATLGQLGRGEEGRREARAVLALKPDFPERGRLLIRHYVKFPEIEERILEGLAASGLTLEAAPA